MLRFAEIPGFATLFVKRYKRVYMLRFAEIPGFATLARR